MVFILSSGGNDSSDNESESSESETRLNFTVGQALNIASKCGKSSIAAKEMCESFMSTRTMESTSLEKERHRLYDNVRRKLDQIIDKKKKNKFRHDKEALEKIFLDQSHDALLSHDYQAESSSDSDGEVGLLGKKLAKMDSPSSSPRKKETHVHTSAKKKETKDASVQVDVGGGVSSYYKPPITDASKNAIQKRSKKLRVEFGKMCDQQGCEEPKELLGLLLYYYTYGDGSGLADVGMKINRGEPILAQHKV